YTELMDRNLYAVIWEAIKNILGIAIIYQQGDWFGASVFFSWINYLLVAYFIVATIITGWLVYRHKKEDASVTVKDLQLQPISD
ncbi:MAG: hypothetical protein ABJA71_02380, partial [Ginsengibacter sp.]